MSADLIAGVSRARLESFRTAQAALYRAARPLSAKLMAQGAAHWLDGVPMHWMTDWPMPHLAVIASAKGSKISDIDGHQIDDFCLGDTGSMFGHSPPPVARAIRNQAGRGLTYMLPSDMAAQAGELLSARFGQMAWQIATTASDANRFAIRVARAVTGRPKILVFNGCYHGTVDDVMVELAQGRPVTRQGQMGQIRDVTDGATCVEFNDLAALEAALAQGDIAAVLTEPVMTNSCMVLPDEGFHSGLRDLTRKYGTLLMMDETHTISSGLGGYSQTHGLSPDMFIIGKCVAGGLATAAWGMTADLAQLYGRANVARGAGHSGMGTTLSANPLQFACLVATLSQVMTAQNYAKMEAGAALLAQGLAQSITRHKAPWHVVRVGARVEFICAPHPLRNGTEAALAHHPAVESALHLGLMNQGSLIAPFHNMMLVSPVTTKGQIKRLIANFDQILTQLFV